MNHQNDQKAQKHVSAGGLVFRREGSVIQVVLISRLGGKVWCLPKGHVEEGESFEQAALREVKEETGLNAAVIQKLGDVEYGYYDKWEKSRIFKTVHFFLLKYCDGDVVNHDHEVDEARWFLMDEVMPRLTYPSEREIFQKALEALEQVTNQET